ncbi:hypothetical protein [Agreia bicolorata]|uniref:Tetratricopeptide repeat-containing protein n=1 Tax=Agreia bicolorata TaxID=110935 RepID=A0ABR5CH35_9MICO|nr:hypothetical protein [Agreia bicolorata]KJC64947.1 hypothetical protein TZ00_04830 [Agreia bicolorata]
MSSSTILELFTQIDALPFGAAERSLIDQAIALADEAGEDTLAYEARLRLTASAKMTGDTDAMLASFGWCLGKHDSDPARFPLKVGELDLLWQFKWMAGTLGASPLFPRAEIEAVLDEMETRYRRAGVGMSGVLQARFDDAVDNLSDVEAENARAALRREPRDDYSHCDACVRSEDAAYLASVGRDAEAIERFDEIVEQNLSCGEEPETALSRGLLSWLRAGELETAKAAHLRSYRLARSNSDNIGIIANHLVFCAVTGNAARGLTLLERHIGWLAHDSLNARAHFAALRAFGVLLDAVVRSGHGDAAVRGAGAAALEPFFGPHEGEWSAAELAEASWRAAESLARAFDERNGNDRHSSLVEQSRALADEHFDLPMQGEGFLPSIPTATEADPVDAAGWLVRARELMGTGAYGDSLAAARRGLEAGRLEAEPLDRSPAGRIRSLLYAVLIQALIAAGDLDEAAARQIDRIAVLRDMGCDDQADIEVVLGLIMLGTAVDDDVHVLEMTLQAADARGADSETRADLALTLGSVHLQEGRAEDALVLFRRAVELLEETPDSPMWISALMFLAHALARTDELAEAVSTLDRLLEFDLDRAFRATAHHLLAQLAGAEGEVEPGLAAADAALALWTRLGHRSGMVDSAVLSASLLRDAGRLDEAVTRWRLAVREAELAERPDVDGLRYGLGRLLVQAGQPEAAAEVLDDVYASEVSSDATAGARAETLFWLGQAHRQSGDGSSAYGAWSRAIELYAEAEDPSGATHAGIALGGLLLAYEDEQSVSVLEEALASARGADELQLLVEALHTLGRARCSFGDAAGLAELDEVLTIARAEEAEWLIADVTDSKARALQQLDRLAEAVPVALSAADGYAASGDEVAAGLAELLAARMLVAQQNAEAAVTIYRGALERLGDVPQAHVAATLELGDALEQLGRHAEAAEARASIDAS